MAIFKSGCKMHRMVVVAVGLGENFGNTLQKTQLIGKFGFSWAILGDFRAEG
jgi:hypothetical protein